MTNRPPKKEEKGEKEGIKTGKGKEKGKKGPEGILAWRGQKYGFPSKYTYSPEIL